MARHTANDGNHYRRLTGHAHANGFPLVTPSAAQSWVKGGLLPRVVYERPRFAVRVPVGVEAIEAQLLALCRLRYHARLRRQGVLAAALWVEGWDINLSVARAGLHAVLDPLARLADEEVRDRFTWRAAQPRNRPAGWTGSLETASLAAAFDALCGRISGASQGSATGLSELAWLEQASGLARARVDQVGQAEPWLDTEPGAGLGEGAEEMAAPRLRQTIDAASDEDLVRARDAGDDLWGCFSLLIPALELGYGTNFAGLGPLSPSGETLDPIKRIMLVLVALARPDEADAMLDGLRDGPDLSEIGWALQRGREIVESDPALAARARDEGLVAALEDRDGGGQAGRR